MLPNIKILKNGFNQIPDQSRVFLMSSHAEKSYLETDFQDGDWLVFGKESVGLSRKF